MAGNILIVDDEKDMLLLLNRILSEDTAYTVVVETDPEKAVDLFRQTGFDLVITDLRMPKMNGITLLEQVKKADPDVAVIMMTAYGTIDTAVQATQKGAFDYITKPFRRERILVTVEKAMQWRDIIKENNSLREELADQKGFASLVGAGRVMQDIFARIRQVAPTTATVLITGPSGTGKELVARALHQHSLRRDNKLIPLNCTAIPNDVLESELFGHVKGAFTGAWQDKQGLVESARGGTLFLDEIGDLSPMLQTKLLRLLQEGEYKPVGSVTTKQADLRFIAATHHDLKADIAAKRFREDLYYRINVIHIAMPSLQGRKEDIPFLSYHFLRKYARLNHKHINSISPTALQSLMLLRFPGNVRELENIIERGVIFCNSDVLRLRDLFLDTEYPQLLPELNSDQWVNLNFKEAKDQMIALFHRTYIDALLRECGGNVSKSAEKAGIQRQYLHRLMRDAGMAADVYKSEG